MAQLKSTTSNIWQHLRLKDSRVFFRSFASLCFSVLAISLSVSAQETADASAPVLHRLTLTPDNVALDSLNANELEISVTLVFEDDNTVSTADFYLENSDSKEQLLFVQEGDWTTSGDFHIGVFTTRISNLEPPGLWYVSSLVVTDSAGNSTSDYDTAEEIMLAAQIPLISTTESSSNRVFDSQIGVSATFSQTGNTQKSYLDLVLEDGIEYELWFVANASTEFESIVFANGISIAQSCTTFVDYTKCRVTSSNNNLAILATVDTQSSDAVSYGYSVLLQPSSDGSEARWLNNYVEFPRVDVDNDGIPNEQDEDDDNDGVNDTEDLFPFDASESLDFDFDGVGNNADTDDDNDGVIDEQDAFPFDPLENNDNDNDGLGDVADNDDDNDLVIDSQDAFPFDPAESLDSDADGIGNNADNDDDNDGGTDDNDAFPLDPTETIDSDGDGIGNNADTDDDNDGVLDVNDAFPRDPSESIDTDEDGIGNNADDDDDNDGVLDVDDLFPLDPLEWADNDLDGQGDNSDNDDDNDGIADADDAFSFDATETLDSDGDGIGNNADTDDDNDGVLDDVDAFPFSAAEQLDSDADGIGNNADQDDDNDGIVDVDDSQPLNPSIGDDQAPIIDGISDLIIEATGPLTTIPLTEPRVRDNNLNPATLSSDYLQPLPLGEHVITWKAVDFAGNISTLAQNVVVQDTTAPVFDESTVLDMRSRGILTDVSQDINESATDLVDGEIDAVLITENNLKAGAQSVILQATDASGNASIKELFVNILPTFTAKPYGVSAPGNRLRLPIVLSGKAPEYPVSVEYTVVGPVTSANSGVFYINQGQRATLDIDVAATANLGDTLWINFANPQNAAIGRLSQIRIDLSNANQAPVADIKLLQNSEVVSLAYQDQGEVTLLANIRDINLDDFHQVVWEVVAQSDRDNVLSIADLNNDNNSATFEFNPTLLEAGEYIARAQISERNTAELYSSSIEFAFSVAAEKPVLSAFIDSDFDGLSDQAEGLSDHDLDGVPDYLDDEENTATLPTGASEQPITTLAGYRLTLGDIAKMSEAQSAANAVISEFDIHTYGLSSYYPDVEVDDPHFNAIQQITNFNIENLQSIGESVPVLIPLNTGSVIPEDAVYRKFNSRDGWFTFVENAHNAIMSAPFDANGNCPETDSSLYLNGLTPGDNCIQLIIQDGGPNDADLTANGLIKDPGVLSARLPNRSPLINVAQQTTVFEGETVRVDASLTTDAEGDELLFSWTQIGGIRINLGENISPLLSFNAPLVSENESLLFRLDVYDGRDTSSVNIRVNISNKNTVPTVAIEAHSNSVEEGKQLTLVADTYDADGDFLSYEWRQISGPSVVLSGQNGQSLSVTLPEVNATASVTLAVFVADSEKQVSASTTITIVDTTPASTSSDGEASGGGTMNIYLLALACVIAWTRRKKSPIAVNRASLGGL